MRRPRSLLKRALALTVLLAAFGLHRRPRPGGTGGDPPGGGRPTRPHAGSTDPVGQQQTDLRSTATGPTTRPTTAGGTPPSQRQSDPVSDGQTDTTPSTTSPFQDYVDSLPTQTPRGTPGSPEQDYQIRHAGDTEYQVSGDGSQVWADGIQGIDTETGQVIDAKYVGNPGRSPFVPGSDCPPFIRDKINAAQANEFARYSDVVNSPDNPLTGLHVITNNPDSATYFQGLMDQHGIPGQVSVRD